MNYDSLPTVEQANLEAYMDVVRQFDPELYLIKIALHETGINPLIVPRIIRAIANVAVGSGYGEIQIKMVSRVVTQIKSGESDIVSEQAIIDK